ncbi:hypothetical protein FRB96_006208 [Tulasnella sp. 330]|nr:hypothetical protein FRB96_006208 [Tulasnella sp. 330]KAG8874291.1 hypothetical protein FRB97_006009 [Tulasnella sp. 331]
MIFSRVFAIVYAVGAIASPLQKRASAGDIEILNFALTLEYLEEAFYQGAFKRWTPQDFHTAGLDYARFQQIHQHEQAHIQLLGGILGSEATQPCKYDFHFTDIKSFAALSQVLEGVGVSAYLGAAADITDPEYLTAAGSILATEARHAAWLAAVANGGSPWSGPFDVPLDLDEVYSIAVTYIKSCPTALPLKAFPALMVYPVGAATTLAAGQPAVVSFAGQFHKHKNYFLVLYTSLPPPNNLIFLPLSATFTVTLPAVLTHGGTVYVILSTSDTVVSDGHTVAGPLVLSFE